MIRYALLIVAAIAIAVPAVAAEWYVVRGPDKKCRVVEKRPTEKTITIVGDKVYVSREEAERQIKVVCRETR